MWYGKYRIWKHDPQTDTDAVKHKTVKLGPKAEMTRFEAEQKLRNLIAQQTGPNNPDDAVNAQNVPTLKWLVEERYFPMMTCGEPTKKKTQYEIRRYILEGLGARNLSSINLFDLQTHLNRLAKHFSESVVRHTYVNLRSIFNAAVDLDVIAKSPSRKLRMPPTRERNKAVLSPDMIMKLLHAIHDPRDRCILAIGIFCGLRTSEVFGLTWDCLRGDTLLVKNTAFEGNLRVNTVKTVESRALVPIPDLAQPFIEAWKALCSDTGEGALMFWTSGKGRRRGRRVPFDSTNFMERRIHPTADQLGIPRHLVTFQVMRRTVATDLQHHGTLKDAQAALRHKSAATTANIYIQPVSTSVRAALNARTESVFTDGNSPVTEPGKRS